MFEDETLEQRRKRLKPKEAPPDHPLYKIGFVFGGKRLKPSTNTSEDAPPPSINKGEAKTTEETIEEIERGIAEELPRQFGKTDE